MVLELITIVAITGSRPSIPSRSYSAPKSSVTTSVPTKSTPPTQARGQLAKPYKNSAGEEVAYRNNGMNWVTHWVLFGWLWHNSDDDHCFDKDQRKVNCK